MPKLLQKTLLILSCCLLANCSLFHMYRPDIQQGNVITPDMVAQLKTGMTEDQVRYVMGTPVLTNSFDPNRWDYVYSFKHGGQPRTQQHVTLMFSDGVLRVIQVVPMTTVK